MMAYTPVSITSSSAPLVAIYPGADTRTFMAYPVVAFAIFRDPHDKDGANFTVPLTAEDLTSKQDNRYRNEREMLAALPVWVRDWEEAFSAASVSPGGYATVRLDAAAGLVIVDE